MTTPFTSLPAALIPPLPDREAVADALYRCCLAWDTNDRALFATSFTSEAVLDLNGRSTAGITEINAVCNSIIFSVDTTHLATNIRIHFPNATNTTTATGEYLANLTATVIAQHFEGGKGMDLTPDDGGVQLMNRNRHLMSGALYSGDLVRDEGDGLWKFARLSIRPNWVEGHFSVVGGVFKGEES
ncbi:nuclear transport factor 2 family protein [Microdochium nivale]|nr:nuclear transport factor 2 family protein [Microdochium nivale]